VSIQISILAGYICTLLLIAWFVRKQAQKSQQALFYADRKLSTLFVTVNVAGLAVGAVTTIGVAELAFSAGIAAAWYNMAWALGAVLMGLTLAKKYNALGIKSLPGYLEQIYGRDAKWFVALGQVFIMMVITSLQCVAGATVLKTLFPEMNFHAGILASGIIFIVMSWLGGLLATALSNQWNVLLIYIGLVLAALATLVRYGGMHGLASNLPPGVNWFGVVGGTSIEWIGGLSLTLLTTTLSIQATVQLAYSAENGRAARRGFLWGALLIFPIGIFCALMGMAARIGYPALTDAKLAMTSIILDLHPVLSGLTLSALWAADISTGVCLLLACSALFCEEILRPQTPKKNNILIRNIGRLSVSVIGLLTLAIAMIPGALLKKLVIALSLLAPYTLIVLATIYFPRLCRKESARAVFLTGLAAWLFWFWVPLGNDPIFLEWIACSIAFFATMRFSRNSIAAPLAAAKN